MPYMRDKSGQVFETENPQFHLECERLKAAEGRALHKAQCADTLRQIAPAGSTVYCVLRDVSRSGMSRRISFFVLQDNRPRCIDYLISVLRVAGAVRHPSKEGLTVSGAGMDMGFHVVHSLASRLYPDVPRAGYSLNHEWL